MILSVLMPIKVIDDYSGIAIHSTLDAIDGLDAELIIIVGHESDFIKAQKATIGRPNVQILTSVVDHIIFKLNVGLQYSSGFYIARMDADDICHARRFKEQLQFIQRNSFDLVFGEANLITNTGEETGVTLKSEFHNIAFQCRLIHPTMLATRDIIKALGGYGNIQHSEDYHLWMKAVASDASIGIQNVPLISYRQHSDQLTNTKNLVDIFKTNVAIKVLISLQFSSFKYAFGSIVDIARLTKIWFRSIVR